MVPGMSVDEDEAVYENRVDHVTVAYLGNTSENTFKYQLLPTQRK